MKTSIWFGKLGLVGGMASLLIAAHSHAEDWPRYRGPQGNGFSAEAGWKKTGEAKVLWKARVGLGYSGVVTAGDMVFTTGHDGSETATVYCLEAKTGRERWKHTYPQLLGDLYFQGGTTGTPTVHEGRLYQVAREGEVMCLEAASGKVHWSTHLARDVGMEKPDWGFTGGALAYGELLLLNAGAAGVALQREDGSVVWQSDEAEAGYSAPYLFRRGERDLVMMSHKRGYTCVEPESGQLLWNVKWLTRYGVNAADPIVSGDLVFLSSGYGKGATLLEWKGTGEPEAQWKSREMRNQMNPSILHEGYLYGIDGNESVDRTGLKCLEMHTGETKWLDESVGHGALIAAEGHLLVVTEQGEVRIGPISPDGFSPTLTAKVLPGRCWTQPTLSGGILFVRDEKGGLAAVDLRNL